MGSGRRSFAECVHAARSLAEETPFAGGWGHSGCSEMQRLGGFCPKQLPEVTGGLEHAGSPLFPSRSALQEELGAAGASVLLKREAFAQGRFRSLLSAFETLPFGRRGLSSCKTRNTAQCIAGYICNSYRERKCADYIQQFLFLIGEK